MGRGNIFVSIATEEKRRLVLRNDVDLSTEHWFNDSLIEF